MSFAEPLTVLKSELVQKIVPELVEVLASALREGTPVHKVEESLWDVLLRAGHQGMKAFFESHGSGDLGSTLTLPSGEDVKRCDQRSRQRNHDRIAVCAFMFLLRYGPSSSYSSSSSSSSSRSSSSSGSSWGSRSSSSSSSSYSGGGGGSFGGGGASGSW